MPVQTSTLPRPRGLGPSPTSQKGQLTGFQAGQPQESFTTIKSRLRLQNITQNLARLAHASSSYQDRQDLQSFFHLAEHGVTTQKLEATLKAILETDGYHQNQKLQELSKNLTQRLQQQKLLEKNPIARALASQSNRSSDLIPLTKNATPVPTFTQDLRASEISYEHLNTQDRLEQTSAFLLPAEPAPEQVAQFRAHLLRPELNQDQALDQVKQTSLQASKQVAVKGLKKFAGKALAKTATKAGLKTAAQVAAGAATGGVGAVAIEGASFLKKYGKKILKAAGAAAALFFIRSILPLINTLSSIASFVGGVSTALAAGVPTLPAIAIGGGGGLVFHKAVVEPAGGYSTLAKNAALKTAQVARALTTATVTPGLVLFSVLGAFGSVIALTWFGMSHMLTAYTVPNPQGAVPYYPVPVTPAPPISVSLQEIFQQSSDLTCIPEALLKAIIERESNALNYTNEQVSFFSNDEWWKNPAAPSPVPPLPNCYQDSLFYSASSGTCRSGYCYDSCTTTGCSDPSFDVTGPAQFRRQTFYGGGCNDPEGIVSGCVLPGSPAAKVLPYLTDHTIPNRCNLRDALLAQAFYVQKRMGLEKTCKPVNQWTTGDVCTAAKNYCGSCGLVEEYQNEIVDGKPIKDYYPCGEYYNPPGTVSNPAGCGAATLAQFRSDNPEATAGYCDSVYYNYQSFL